MSSIFCSISVTFIIKLFELSICTCLFPFFISYSLHDSFLPLDGVRFYFFFLMSENTSFIFKYSVPLYACLFELYFSIYFLGYSSDFFPCSCSSSCRLNVSGYGSKSRLFRKLAEPCLLEPRVSLPASSCPWSSFPSSSHHSRLLSVSRQGHLLYPGPLHRPLASCGLNTATLCGQPLHSLQPKLYSLLKSLHKYPFLQNVFPGPRLGKDLYTSWKQ